MPLESREVEPHLLPVDNLEDTFFRPALFDDR